MLKLRQWCRILPKKKWMVLTVSVLFTLHYFGLFTHYFEVNNYN